MKVLNESISGLKVLIQNFCFSVSLIYILIIEEQVRYSFIFKEPKYNILYYDELYEGESIIFVNKYKRRNKILKGICP